MRQHRTDGVSLSFGLIFLAVALWWGVSQVVTVHLPALGWVVAGGLIAFGVVGLLVAIHGARRTTADAATRPPEVAPTEPPGDLPPEMHASIVRDLLEDPAESFSRDQAGRPRRE